MWLFNQKTDFKREKKQEEERKKENTEANPKSTFRVFSKVSYLYEKKKKKTTFRHKNACLGLRRAKQPKNKLNYRQHGRTQVVFPHTTCAAKLLSRQPGARRLAILWLIGRTSPAPAFRRQGVQRDVRCEAQTGVRGSHCGICSTQAANQTLALGLMFADTDTGPLLKNLPWITQAMNGTPDQGGLSEAEKKTFGNGLFVFLITNKSAADVTRTIKWHCDGFEWTWDLYWLCVYGTQEHSNFFFNPDE